MDPHADNDDNADDDNDADTTGGWIIVRSELTPSRTKKTMYRGGYIRIRCDNFVKLLG